MKKTIIIIILAVYIASIAIVNFFGLEITVFEGVTYAESIVCNTVTLRNANPTDISSFSSIQDGDKSIPLFTFKFTPSQDGKPYTSADESILSNPNVIEMNYDVFPHAASDKSVKFKFDEEAMQGVAIFHNMSNYLIFLKPGIIVYVTIEALVQRGEANTTIALLAIAD